MIIEQIGEDYIVSRTKGYHTSYFCFWVDADKHSWSRHFFGACRFKTVDDAKTAIREILRRDAMRRKGRRK